MFKVCVLLALAITTAAAQEAAPSEAAAAAEPYSYAYQTDSHAASEQRDPSGKVTGFYTLVDADGRERRVEYAADESGFHAKVATNEVGTKSESPADVEFIASEPTPNQFVFYQQSPPQQTQQVAYQGARQQFVQTTAPRVTTTTVQQQQQPFRQVSYVQQPQTATYGYGYGNSAYYGYNPGYGYGSGYGSYQNVGNYNNHLPSQYYRSISSSSGVAPSSYSVSGGNTVRYVSQPGVTTTGVRTVSYPGSVSYGSSYGPAGVTTSTRTVGASSNPAGSSNYLVLQKREADDKKKDN